MANRAANRKEQTAATAADYLRLSMSNRMGSRTESVVVTSAGVIHELERFPASSGWLDSTAMAFEHVLASLARLEARLDATERRQSVAHPPPWPDPDPPFDDGQRGRGDSARNMPIMSTATAVASHPLLGFDGAQARGIYNPPHSEGMPWDAYGSSSAGFRPDQTQQGFAGQPRGRFLPPNSETTQWDRYGAVNDGFRGRRPTAWDNPAHRVADQPERRAPQWENAWGRQEGGRYSEPPRYEQYHVEKPRYEKMRAPRYEKSEVETKKVPNIVTSRNVKVGNVPTVGVAGNFASTTEIRNKIACLRDLLDFSPCSGSATLRELLVLTLHDIFQRYPKIKPASEFQDAFTHEVLRIFCDTLQSIGNLWTTEKWMFRCSYVSSMKLQHSELEHIAVLMLEDIIKLARERSSDEMDDDDDNLGDYSLAGNPFSKARSGPYFDIRSPCCGSTMTPTSILQGEWRSPTCSEGEPCSPPVLLPVRVGKLSPVDRNRLSFHTVPRGAATAQDPHYMVLMNNLGKEPRENSREDEVMDELEMVDIVIHDAQNDVTKMSSLVRRNGRNWIGVTNQPTPQMVVGPWLQTLLELPFPKPSQHVASQK